MRRETVLIMVAVVVGFIGLAVLTDRAVTEVGERGLIGIGESIFCGRSGCQNAS